MKLSLFVFFALALTLSIFSSCKKDEDTNPDNSPKNNTTYTVNEFFEIIEDSTCFYYADLPIHFTMPDQSVLSITSYHYATFPSEVQVMKDWYTNNPTMTAIPEMQFPINIGFNHSEATFLINDFATLAAASNVCDQTEAFWSPLRACFSATYPATIVFPDNSSFTGNNYEEIALYGSQYYLSNPSLIGNIQFQYPIDIQLYSTGATQNITSQTDYDNTVNACN